MDEFISKILELALGQGLWAVLYIYLFLRMLSENKDREEHVLAENKAREDRYQATIDRLSRSIESKVSKIQITLEEIKLRDNQRKEQ